MKTFVMGSSSQHSGIISSLVLSVYSFCMCSQILTDFLIMFSVFVLMRFTLYKTVGYY